MLLIRLQPPATRIKVPSRAGCGILCHQTLTLLPLTSSGRSRTLRTAPHCTMLDDPQSPSPPSSSALLCPASPASLRPFPRTLLQPSRPTTPSSLRIPPPPPSAHIKVTMAAQWWKRRKGEQHQQQQVLLVLLSFLLLLPASYSFSLSPLPAGPAWLGTSYGRCTKNLLSRTSMTATSEVQQDKIPLEDEKSLQFPWSFKGRVWFQPRIVRTQKEGLPQGAYPLSVFGWSLGGVVCLEYDESPFGSYLEFVEMGSLVLQQGFVGHWGKRLCVSTKEAEERCKEIWGVPAESISIDFDRAASEGMSVEQGEEGVKVRGWNKLGRDKAEQYWGSIPLLWTPQVKTLWFPVQLGGGRREEEEEEGLRLHRLRVSGKDIRITLDRPRLLPSGEFLPGIGLGVKNVKIEISERLGAKL
eukprot:768292-Hanusia_phi.AAC.1